MRLIYDIGRCRLIFGFCMYKKEYLKNGHFSVIGLE